ncbi:MAG: hypothetical protein FWE47_04165 [Oscillospiraceae bacterium]|nr:hypothetical protein [Oscillospiraceae bacterium]
MKLGTIIKLVVLPAIAGAGFTYNAITADMAKSKALADYDKQMEWVGQNYNNETSREDSVGYAKLFLNYAHRDEFGNYFGPKNDELYREDTTKSVRDNIKKSKVEGKITQLARVVKKNIDNPSRYNAKHKRSPREVGPAHMGPGHHNAKPVKVGPVK